MARQVYCRRTEQPKSVFIRSDIKSTPYLLPTALVQIWLLPFYRKNVDGFSMHDAVQHLGSGKNVFVLRQTSHIVTPPSVKDTSRGALVGVRPTRNDATSPRVRHLPFSPS